MAVEILLEVLVTIPFVVGFLVSIAFAPGLIDMLKRHRMGQVISEHTPESHRVKAGTPSMGGLIILAGIFAGSFATLLTSRNPEWVLNVNNLSRHQDLTAVLYLVVGYALIGLLDDYLTIRQPGGVRGIPSKPKAALQLLFAAAFLGWTGLGRPGGFVPVLVVGGQQVLSGIYYWIFAAVYIVGMANFINITDGLDGLASGLVSLAATAFLACVLFLPGGGRGECDITLYGLLSAVAGACLAFLWFNASPARVFMGDTGSLAIGVALPAAAIIAHREILLLVLGLVFLAEGLSTTLQWAVFKCMRITTGAGRRVFRKSPIHHHFELSGWSEQTIVVRFWILGVVAAVIGFAGAALRLW
ncbi:MAG: phospho-N-acetylmuramoyl-pentapeptide-transferase [Armatimonadota bacterium]